MEYLCKYINNGLLLQLNLYEVNKAVQTEL